MSRFVDTTKIPPIVWAAPWTVFMVLPILAAISSNAPPAWRTTGIAALVAFWAGYLAAFWWGPRRERSAVWHATTLAVLTVLMVLAVPAAGWNALSCLPFLAAYMGFGLNGFVRWAGPLAIASVLVVIATSTGEFAYLYFILPVLFILFSSTMERWGERTNARYRELARREAIADERDRMSRDVHDGLGHTLTALTLKAQVAARLVEADPAAAKRELAAIEELSRDALGQMRATVTGLRVANLADEVAAARELLHNAGVKVAVVGTPEDVDPRHRVLCAWAVRELATNVARHAQASSVEIRLTGDGVRVTDDGVGIEGTGSAMGVGNGLRGLAERVAQASGRVCVEPRSGSTSGTRAAVRFES